jgi:hypothetical protein
MIRKVLVCFLDKVAAPVGNQTKPVFELTRAETTETTVQFKWWWQQSTKPHTIVEHCIYLLIHYMK